MKYPEDFINKVICGDCLEVMKDIPDNSIDMVLTSPPYDNLRDYEGYNFSFEGIADQLKRVVNNDGGVVVWVVKDSIIDGSKSLTSFRQAIYFKDIGFKVHEVIIWHKDTFSFPDKNRHGDVFEYIFVLMLGNHKADLIVDRKNFHGGSVVHGTSRAKDGKTFRKSNHHKKIIPGFGKRFNIWHIPAEKNNRYGHPAPFPMSLVKDCIRTWSKRGGIVFDPMMGSGTTLVGAKELGRNFIGIDISQKYCDIANKRLEQEVLI